MVSEVGQQPDALEATDRRYVEAKIPVELGRIHGSAAKARRIQPRKSKREILVSVKKKKRRLPTTTATAAFDASGFPSKHRGEKICLARAGQ
jgi:hypothetical protein